jgi:murein DD-endopeptidase MepM/ murein hydrolase activator NlpD
VLAAAAGRVTLARPVAGRGVVVVQHGELRTTYEPVEGLVLPGQWVSRGDVLGRVGHQSHCPTLTCLHWGLRRGDAYLDPRTLLLGSASPLRLLPATAADLVTRRSAERAERDEAMAAGAGRVMAHHRGAGRHGFRRPVPGPVSSPFGRRFHPIRQVWSLHDGTDFTAPCGAPIAAAYDGVVRQRTWHPAYGQRLIIDHGRVDGSLVSTAYNHAARYVARPGQRVARGEIIGYVGSTGLSTGCHLHLMLWLDGRLTDPLSWL